MVQAGSAQPCSKWISLIVLSRDCHSPTAPNGLALRASLGCTFVKALLSVSLFDAHPIG